MADPVSALENVEEALRAAHAESELFINFIPSILIGTDAAGRITRWNLAATAAFGLSASSVLGKSLQNCGINWSSPDATKEIDSWRQIRKGSLHSELLFQKNGKQRFLGLSITRPTFVNQQSGGLLITGADVTERRELEMQLRQAQKLEAVGQLAAGIAHEINTPTQYVGDNINYVKESWITVSKVLRAVQTIDAEARNGCVSAEALALLHRCLEAENLDGLLEEIPKAVDQSLEGVQRVAGIVRAMKDFSHPGCQQKTTVDINRAIESTVTIARNEWKYVAEVETCFESNLPLVECHPGELNQVILNLIVNAAQAIRDVVGDASQGKGKIKIETRREGDAVEIAVHDTGCGIPEAIQPRIFEPFFTTKPVGQGTGQGLAIARTIIVRGHGGRLWFESTPGKGTTFFIRLPISSGKSGL